MANIIIKKYEHYNRSLGKYIASRSQYETEMRKQGMVSYEKGQRLAEAHKRKPYKLSKKAVPLIKHLDHRRGEKDFSLRSREIDAMKEVGVKICL